METGYFDNTKVQTRLYVFILPINLEIQMHITDNHKPDITLFTHTQIEVVA